MWRLALGILGVGVLAAAAAGGGDDDVPYEPPGPGPLPDVTIIPGHAQPPLVLTGVKLFTVKGTKVLPKLKGVPVTTKLALPQLICNGGPGVIIVPASIMQQYVQPVDPHASWGLSSWCVANVAQGAAGGLPAGAYLAVFQQNGAALVFGPYVDKLSGAKGGGMVSRYVWLAQGLKNILSVSVDKAKGWAI